MSPGCPRLPQVSRHLTQRARDAIVWHEESGYDMSTGPLLVLDRGSCRAELCYLVLVYDGYKLVRRAL